MTGPVLRTPMCREHYSDQVSLYQTFDEHVGKPRVSVTRHRPYTSTRMWESLGPVPHVTTPTLRRACGKVSGQCYTSPFTHFDEYVRKPRVSSTRHRPHTLTNMWESLESVTYVTAHTLRRTYGKTSGSVPHVTVHTLRRASGKTSGQCYTSPPNTSTSMWESLGSTPHVTTHTLRRTKVTLKYESPYGGSTTGPPERRSPESSDRWGSHRHPG